MTTPDPARALDALLTVPEIWGYAPSPDGAWVAWTWMGVAETLTVYAARTNGSGAPVALASNGQNAWIVSWLSDNSGVIVAQDTDGDEKVELFRVDLAAPNTLHRLTSAHPDYYIKGGQMHPNGRWLIYSANVDEGGTPIEGSWVYRHDLQTGERFALARPNNAAFYAPSLNPAGTHVLYYRQDLHPSGLQLWLVGIDGSGEREIVNVGIERKVTGVWSPDGQHILIRAEVETHNRIGVWSLEMGDLRWLIDEPARTIEDIAYPINSPYAIIYEVVDTRYRTFLLDVATGEEIAFAPTSPQTFIPLAPTPDGDTFSALVYSGQQLDDIVRVTPDGRDRASLSHVWDRAAITREDLIPGEDFRWTSDDGLAIQGWLYRGRGENQGTILFVHGGPTWHLEDRVGLTEQFLASQGFNVLAPNYRGSTGFNRAYQESIKVDGWGGREQDDIRAGIEALIAAGIAQPGRVGITGTSYGGYSSWCAITRLRPDLVAAAAPICGMTDLVVDYNMTRPDLRPYSAEMMGGSPLEMPERYFERSPVNHVANIRGRLLIVQGEQDPNVTPENVTVVRRALDAAGIPYEVLMFADEGHGIHRRANQRTLLVRLAGFFTSPPSPSP